LTLTLICFFLDEWTKPTTLTSLCFFMDEWIKPMRLTLLLIFHGWIKPLAFTLFLFFHGWKTNDGPPWLKQKLTWTIIEHMIMSWFHALCRYYRKCHSQLDSPRAEKGHKNWENKLTKSISIGAQYVTPPHSKNYCEKVKMCRFSSRNSFFPHQIRAASCSGYGSIFLIGSHNDWSMWFAISSPHVFTVPDTVLLVGLPQNKQLNLDI
jgi:hypothetical protein